ncbi:hypothetical protein LO763_19965 [Glycomyces sp. A-F 0318]|uniref:hypothetical protein n=1 Tax=Glycomyces amatae TaxID=2881355 RepID=UPI001E4123AC|nr:hypothetical protein [Glycomyces amatae]MCD0445890.1 hypothetical protein [Glycomyces amatae]
MAPDPDAVPSATVHALDMRSTNGWILEVIDTPEHCAVTEPTSDQAIATARSKVAAILGLPVANIEILMANGIYDEGDGTWAKIEANRVGAIAPWYLQRRDARPGPAEIGGAGRHRAPVGEAMAPPRDAHRRPRPAVQP